MKALIFKSDRQFEIEDVPNPRITRDEVLISVKACGICGSDVHGMDGRTGRRLPPIIMGHEAAGVIFECGADVTGWKPGDRVTFDSTVYCGQCEFCRTGRVNLCDRRRVLGVSCQDYRQQGAFADLVTVSERGLYRLPETLPFEYGAMVEPVSIAFHALHRATPSVDDKAIVIGAGIIGLFIVQALCLAGCRKIIAVDIANDKLRLAGELGATHTINSNKGEIEQEVLGITGGGGATMAFEAVGTTVTVDMAVRSVRKGGSVVLVGNVSPKVELPLQLAVTRELKLLGSCASSGEYPACLEAIASGKIKVAPLISAIVPLSEGANWFNRLYRKEPGLLKIILCPDAAIELSSKAALKEFRTDKLAHGSSVTKRNVAFLQTQPGHLKNHE